MNPTRLSLRLLSAPTVPLLVSAFTASWSAHADFFIHSWESQHAPERTLRLTPEILIYSAIGNFSEAGSTVDVTGLQSYSRFGFETTFAYGFNEYVTAYARFTWHRTEVQMQGQAAATGYGLADQTIGMNLRALGAKPGAYVTDTDPSLDLQVQLDFPAYNNGTSMANRTPALGDQSKDVTVGILAQAPLTDTTSGSQSHVAALFGGAGYTYRTESYAMAIPWSAGFRVDPMKSGLLLKAGVVGTTSLTNDGYTNPGVTRHPDVPLTASGGLFTSGAVNPSLIAGQLKVGYQNANFLSVHASGLLPFYGKNAPNGLGVFAGLTIHFLPSSSAHSARRASAAAPTPVHPRSANSQRPNQNFITYTAFEGKITRVNDRLNLIKMDQGSNQQVQAGQVFDLFSVNKSGGPKEWVARARCTEAQEAEATLTVETFYKEVLIEEGFIVKMPMPSVAE